MSDDKLAEIEARYVNANPRGSQILADIAYLLAQVRRMEPVFDTAMLMIEPYQNQDHTASLLISLRTACFEARETLAVSGEEGGRG